jgi:hypothetical protein
VYSDYLIDAFLGFIVELCQDSANGSTILACKAFYDLERAPVIPSFRLTFTPATVPFHESVPAWPVVPTIHLPLDEKYDKHNRRVRPGRRV